MHLVADHDPILTACEDPDICGFPGLAGVSRRSVPEYRPARLTLSLKL